MPFWDRKKRSASFKSLDSTQSPPPRGVSARSTSTPAAAVATAVATDAAAPAASARTQTLSSSKSNGVHPPVATVVASASRFTNLTSEISSLTTASYDNDSFAVPHFNRERPVSNGERRLPPVSRIRSSNKVASGNVSSGPYNSLRNNPLNSESVERSTQHQVVALPVQVNVIAAAPNSSQPLFGRAPRIASLEAEQDDDNRQNQIRSFSNQRRLDSLDDSESSSGSVSNLERTESDDDDDDDDGVDVDNVDEISSNDDHGGIDVDNVDEISSNDDHDGIDVDNVDEISSNDDHDGIVVDYVNEISSNYDHGGIDVDNVNEISSNDDDSDSGGDDDASNNNDSLQGDIDAVYPSTLSRTSTANLATNPYLLGSSHGNNNTRNLGGALRTCASYSFPSSPSTEASGGHPHRSSAPNLASANLASAAAIQEALKEHRTPEMEAAAAEAAKWMDGTYGNNVNNACQYERPRENHNNQLGIDNAPDNSLAFSSTANTTEQQVQRPDGHPCRTPRTSMSSSAPMSSSDLEDARSYASHVRKLCQQDEVDYDSLDIMTQFLVNYQNRMANHTIPEEFAKCPNQLDFLCTLNDILLEAIEEAKKKMEHRCKPPEGAVLQSHSTNILDIPGLVQRKDIFSLICLLRAQQIERRLDAAWALMCFARDDLSLRNEIRSSGGMHSLLTLFRTAGTMYELKIVAALAVAYVLPSFVESASQTLPSLGLKIMECLRELSQARRIAPNAQVVTEKESYEVSVRALWTYWIYQLMPTLQSERIMERQPEQNVESSLRRALSLSGRNRNRAAGSALFDQRRETIELQELLEMTVALIIYIGTRPIERSDESVRYDLVEQVCVVEVARPIAVREKVLSILVDWMQSKDLEKMRAAVSALRHLTSIKDKYMAGWIHSQMINADALRSIVELNQLKLGVDIELAVAQILSSLCVAPHTRAAVVEAEGIDVMIEYLDDHGDVEERIFYAASALVQIAAGAITRASVFGDDDPVDSVSADKRDTVIGDIIEMGAIEAFVAIALKHPGKLRTVSIEALRVLSEDISPKRQTRGDHLCQHNAAKALGVTLKENVAQNRDLLWAGEVLPQPESVKELHEALCCLANILDPLPESASSVTNHHRLSSSVKNTRLRLIYGCIETAESGGLEALLFVASLPIARNGSLKPFDSQRMSLLEEACRSIASMSPLLLTDHVAAEGYSIWTDDVLKAVFRVMHQAEVFESLDDLAVSAVEVQVNVLRALAALARSEPLKVRVIDKALPYLLQKNSGDRTDVSDAASQAFQSLGFADDEVAVQVAGNNPQLLADWFCLERSYLLQAMARDEIKRTVIDIWGLPFKSLSELGVSRIDKEVSDFSQCLSDECNADLDIFENFVNDSESAGTRTTMIEEYHAIYSRPDARKSQELLTVADESDETTRSISLLSSQVFPLSSSDEETEWVLSHCSALRSNSNRSDSVLSPHVESLLQCCFPSTILRYEIIPIYSFRPGASFNFRALMMPKKKYFSFRREGQLLSRLCANESARLDTTDVHWTLGFTNSSFAGEFSESLVQALYLCPMILGLSFSKVLPKSMHTVEETNSTEGSSIFPHLAGSLPPWITNLTFDGLLSDRDMKELVGVLKTMGKLITGHELRLTPSESNALPGRKQETSSTTSWQGKFNFFAVRRCNEGSNPVSKQTWKSFFGLLGKLGPGVQLPAQSPLSSLRILDLSGNCLGDELCALVLGLIHNDGSGCCLEKLDLSGNDIFGGYNVRRVLRQYVDRFSLKSSGSASQSKTWTSPLHTLYLANNGLNDDKAWFDIVGLLKDNGLELQELDLSSNGITISDTEVKICDFFSSSIAGNTFLNRLNISGNMLSARSVDRILSVLSSYKKDSVLAFLQIDSNLPVLSTQQKSVLLSFSVRSRRALLQRTVSERNFNHLEETTAEDLAALVETDRRLHGRANSISDEKEDDDSLVPDYEPSRRPSLASVGSAAAEFSDANKITVLFSAPLVYADGNKVLRPFDKLDFKLERELMWQCLKEASRDIKLCFDNATHDRFLAAMSQRCSCLHYSGHGHEQFLPFEDKGGAHWLSVDAIRDLIASRGGASFKFVFVAACHSYLAGIKFADAGVPHVVCCQQESELKDQAALAFTRQFYLSLAVGHTVKDSFDHGCKAVRASPNLRNAEQEMKKFLLLPPDGNHDIPVFNARSVMEWPQNYDQKMTSNRHRRKSLHVGGTRTSELSVRNMMQEDPSPSPPQFFLGREVDMFQVLQQIFDKRLVSVTGETGIGRSSLVCALCHYINERATTMTNYIQRIYFVRVKQGRRRNNCRSLLQNLLQKLVDAGKVDEKNEDDIYDDVETLCDVICTTLKTEKALVVFDRVDWLEDEENEFSMILSRLQRETRNAKVLMTNRRPLGIPSICEKAIELGPLQFCDTVRLFANLCSFIHTPNERKNFYKAIIKDASYAELLATDPCLPSQIQTLFSVMGDGVPTKVEKAAYNISKEMFFNLYSGNVM